MAYTFLTGSTLIVDYGGIKYELLVSSFEADQILIESTQNVKTIHDKELLSRSYTSKKGNTSFSFSCYLTTTGVSEGFIFDWFGFTKNQSGQLSTGTQYNIITDGDDYPDTATIYLVSPYGSTQKITGAVLESLSLTLTSNSVLSLTISGSGLDFLSVPTMDTYDITQRDRPFLNGVAISCLIGDLNVPHFTLISMEYSKGVTWMDQKSLFDSNTYTPNYYYTSNLNITGTIEAYKTDDAARTEYISPITITAGGLLEFYFPTCHVADRPGVQEVFMAYKDYKVNPSSTPGTIKYI